MRRFAAWDGALRTVGDFGTVFSMAGGRNEAVARRYKNAEAFFGPRKASAARGAATRNRHAKAKKAHPSNAAFPISTTSVMRISTRRSSNGL